MRELTTIARTRPLHPPDWTRSLWPVIELSSLAFPGTIVIRRSFHLAALAALLVGGALAAAQIPASTHEVVRSSSPPGQSEVQRSDAVFRDLVACVVRHQPSRTRNLLDTVPGSYGEADIVRTLWPRMETCFDYYRVGGRALVIDNLLVRGAIAETYYRNEFPAGIAAAAPAGATEAWIRPRDQDGEVTHAEMLHSMARCVTVRRPAEVSSMLNTDPLSAEERAALRLLQTDLSACLDSGVQFAASRQSLRALLAEAALHYAEASRSGFSRVGSTDSATAE